MFEKVSKGAADVGDCERRGEAGAEGSGGKFRESVRKAIAAVRALVKECEGLRESRDQGLELRENSEGVGRV